MFFHLFSALKDLLCFTGSYSNEVFPEPLTPKEEEEYILKKEKGDKNARNQLIEHNLRLVAHIVKKFDPKNKFKPTNSNENIFFTFIFEYRLLLI